MGKRDKAAGEDLRAPMKLPRAAIECLLFGGDFGFDAWMKRGDCQQAQDFRIALRRKLNGDTR